jgi:hypothetical protein
VSAPIAETRPIQANRPKRAPAFWLLAALIGLATAPLAGLLGAALIWLYLIVQNLPTGIDSTKMTETGSILFSLGFIYALPLAPLSALCVPLAYRQASRNAHMGRWTFVVLGSLYGLFGPLLVGVLISLVAWEEGPVYLSAIYGGLGALLAPLCALAIWPILRKNDELAVP